MGKYAVSVEATPVLNSPEFEAIFGGADGKTVKTDEQGLIREVEFIALPGMIFRVVQENHGILKVTALGYEYDGRGSSDLYVDGRFVQEVREPEEREAVLPEREEIYEFLDNAVGSKYIWGGNWIKGIGKMLEYYKPSGEISEETQTLWTLKGCDCSGLMYEATKGYTKRNTSMLVESGKSVEVEGLTVGEITKKLQPLDMMVWRGHVIYVYDEKTAIQSALSKGGVVKTDLVETIEELMMQRKPVNEYNDRKWGDEKRFVVRRWYEAQ